MPVAVGGSGVSDAVALGDGESVTDAVAVGCGFGKAQDASIQPTNSIRHNINSIPLVKVVDRKKFLGG